MLIHFKFSPKKEQQRKQICFVNVVLNSGHLFVILNIFFVRFFFILDDDDYGEKENSSRDHPQRVVSCVSI
jgi:hypothetical protein